MWSPRNFVKPFDMWVHSDVEQGLEENKLSIKE